jgi:hypothetical protein
MKKDYDFYEFKTCFCRDAKSTLANTNGRLNKAAIKSVIFESQDNKFGDN